MGIQWAKPSAGNEIYTPIGFDYSTVKTGFDYSLPSSFINLQGKGIVHECVVSLGSYSVGGGDYKGVQIIVDDEVIYNVEFITTDSSWYNFGFSTPYFIGFDSNNSYRVPIPYATNGIVKPELKLPQTPDSPTAGTYIVPIAEPIKFNSNFKVLPSANTRWAMQQIVLLKGGWLE